MDDCLSRVMHFEEFATSARRKDDVGAFGVVSEKRTYWFAATADETVLWLVALRAILAK
jgi:hypothetical protein